jgi:predicted methyltransferase
MPVRLTQKNKDIIVKQLDDILVNHRLKIYQQLQPVMSRSNRDQIQALIVQLNNQLMNDLMPVIDELVTHEPPELPII